MKKNKELTENQESKEVIINRLLQLIETNSNTLQNHYNEHSPKSTIKQYKDIIRGYLHELSEVVGYKIKNNKLSHEEGIDLFFTERKKIEEVQKQLKIQEEKKREDSELGRDNIILMLEVHRKFAEESLFGNFERFESEGFKMIKGSKLIDFTTFARFMTTDKVIHSYCEDIRVNDFAWNLSERSEYFGKDFEWNISIIDIEILFDILRENQFILSDTPRSVFFEIFNPNLSVFTKPVIWKDVKELAYFFDKCKEYSLFENSKYQNIIEKYRMFKSNLSGEFLTARSISSTLSNVKSEFGDYSENQRFLKRVEFFEEMFIEMDCYSNKILREEEED